MRIISFNCDGVHQATQRGLFEWLQDQDADIICLQDLRATEIELETPGISAEWLQCILFRFTNSPSKRRSHLL